MLGETWNFWVVRMWGSDSTDVAVVLVSDAGSVAVVAGVTVGDDSVSSGFRDGPSTMTDDGTLGKRFRRSLRHSYDMDLRSADLDSNSVLLGRTRKASITA